MSEAQPMEEELASHSRTSEYSVKTRLAIWLVGWTLMSLPIPSMYSEWTLRWLIFSLVGLVWGAVALYARRPKQNAERSPKLDPETPAATIEGLVSRSLDRADRTTVAWLTILGAAHSAFIGYAARRPNFFFDADDGTTLGGLLVVLGVLCYAGSHAMTSTRAQVQRALRLAIKLESSGKYFRFVYKDEAEPPAIARQLVPLVSLFGYLWFCGGVFLVLIHFLFSAVGL